MPHKWKSSLLGLACGNSYGVEYEGCDPDENRQLPLCPRQPLESDDDSEMAHIALAHVIQHGSIQPDILFESYRVWARKDGKGIGIHTANVLQFDPQDKDSEGNGSLMRMLPCALYLYEKSSDFKWTASQVHLEATITHDTPMVHAINLMFLDLAIYGLDALNRHDIVLQQIRQCNDLSAWVRSTANVVLDVARHYHERPLVEGFQELARRGGDVDTTCAIYGALMGAWRELDDEIEMEQYLAIKWLGRFRGLEEIK